MKLDFNNRHGHTFPEAIYYTEFESVEDISVFAENIKNYDKHDIPLQQMLNALITYNLYIKIHCFCQKKSFKLMCTFQNKSQYMVHNRLLKTSLNYGLIF